jgi:PST family polysaccharide transporter
MIKLFKDLLINSVYLYLFQALNYILPFLILPYLLHTLSLQSFGIFAFSQSVAQFLVLVVDFGFNLSVSKKIAALPKDSPEISFIYWQVIYTKFCLLLVVFVPVLICFSLLTALSVYKTAVYCSMIALAGTVIFPVWLYQGLNEMKAMSLITAISKLLTLPLMFFVVKGQNDYLPAIIIHSASILLAGIISLIFILAQKKYHRGFSRKATTGRSILLQIKEGWHFFLSNASISLYTNSLTLLLGFYGTTTDVGAFGAIERVVKIICFAIYAPLNQAAYPILARLRLTNFSNAVQLFRILFYGVAVLMAVVILLFFLFGSNLVLNLLGQAVNFSILQIAIFTVLPIALGGVCGQLGLVALGSSIHKSVFSKIYISTGLISLAVCFFAIRFFSVNGAVFSMMVTEFTIFIAMAAAVKKYRFL